VPVSYYGVTKYAAERYVHVTAERTDLATPLHATSFRMFNVYGPRQRLDNPYQGVLAIFLGQLLRSERVTVHGDGEQSRDFVHVSDVVRAWADAIDDPASFGRVYNLGSGTPTSVNTLLDTLLAERSLDRDSYPIDAAPAQQGDIRVSAADISRITAELGWRPSRPLAEGLVDTVAWAEQVDP
jgi:UDP-glucose 4-epimerase